MKARLICLVRRHQWHNGWDEDRHQTVWTCRRCGATRRSDEMGDPRLMPGGLRGLVATRPWGWGRRHISPTGCWHLLAMEEMTRLGVGRGMASCRW
jgi:hypothetical protein